MKIETTGNRLKLVQGEYPPAILMATSTRFRIEGMGLSTFVDFQITDGRATTLKVPWAPDERWERKKAEAGGSEIRESGSGTDPSP